MTCGTIHFAGVPSPCRARPAFSHSSILVSGKPGTMRNVTLVHLSRLCGVKNLNAEDSLLNTMASLVNSSSTVVSRLGARSIVLSKLADAVVPLLTHAQRDEATVSFRIAIEDIMAVMDDTILPADYHSALFVETNVCLEMLHHLQRRVRRAD